MKREVASGPRQRDREASTRALLNAGIEAFSEQGYDATTTKGVAQRAGLNEQLITRYFGGKMGLLMAVYRDLLERQEDDRAYEMSPIRSDPRAEIIHFVQHKRRHFLNTRTLMTIVLTRILSNPNEAQSYDLSFLTRMRGVFVQRMQSFQLDGRVRADSDLGRLGEALMQHVFMRCIIEPAIWGGSDVPEEQLIAFASDLCQGVVLQTG